MRFDPGAGSFSDSRLRSNGAKLENLYIVPRTEVEGHPGSYFVQNSAGLAEIADTNTGACAGMARWTSKMYGVFGTKFFEVLPTLTELADIPGTGFCEFAEERVGLVIIRDTKSYLWNGTTIAPFDVPVAGSPEPVSSAVQFDGYTIYAIEGSDKMYASLPLDPDEIDPINFATGEARPDPTVRLLMNNQSMWVFGETTIELFYNAGQQGFPFLRYQNSMMEKGLLAKESAISLHDNVIFLATDRKVYSGSGLDATPISLPWLEELLGRVSRDDIKSSYAVAYTSSGANFYALTIPNWGTFEFNDRSRLWSHRKSPTRTDWISKGWVYYNSDFYVGSVVDGRIYKINPALTYEGTTKIEYEMVTSPFGPKETRTSLNFVDTHIAAIEGDPALETFRLDYTDDEGRTFRGLRTMAFPIIDKTRAIARQLGWMRRRQLRWRYSGDTSFRIEDLYIDMASGWPRQGHYRPEHAGPVPQQGF